ncbi:hypothetical protein Trydic_g17013 [Trypoxylus dichotomus]
MLWGCISWYGESPLHKLEGITNADVYVNTLQIDNDPQHVSRKAKTWFRNNNVGVLSWPSQSPHTIDNLGMELEKAAFAAKPQNIDDL